MPSHPSAGADFSRATGGGFEELILKFPRAALRSASPSCTDSKQGPCGAGKANDLKGQCRLKRGSLSLAGSEGFLMAGAGVLEACQGKCLVKDSQKLSEAPHGSKGLRGAQAVFPALSQGSAGADTAEGGRERACPPRRLRRAQEDLQEPSRGAVTPRQSVGRSSSQHGDYSRIRAGICAALPRYVYYQRSSSALSAVEACLYPRVSALRKPFGLTTPGGKPVNNSSSRRIRYFLRGFRRQLSLTRLLFNWA